MSFSSASAEVPLAYSPGVQFMHWASGGCMLASIGLVHAAQNTKDKKEKGDYMFYHKSFGTTALLLVAPRVWIRYYNI